jgi:hypothetical protein
MHDPTISEERRLAQLRGAYSVKRLKIKLPSKNFNSPQEIQDGIVELINLVRSDQINHKSAYTLGLLFKILSEFTKGVKTEEFEGRLKKLEEKLGV